MRDFFICKIELLCDNKNTCPVTASPKFLITGHKDKYYELKI